MGSLTRPLRIPLLLLPLLMVIGGCASSGKPGPDPEGTESSSSAESVLRALVREYEIRNVAGFMDRVHVDYEAGTMNRNDLRYQVSRVQNQYGNIDLKLYGLRDRDGGSTKTLRTDWELSWTCRSPGPGCSMNDEEVRRRGRTTFVLRRTARGWRLISERDSPLFGRFRPGRVVR